VALTIASGALYINGSNSYTGPTLVQNGGSLRGTGSVRSSVTIQSGGVLSPGASIGTLTISSNLILTAGSTNIFEVNSTTLAHDLISGLKNVAYGGTLVISNVSASPYTNGQSFQLFSATTRGGGFAAIVPDTPGPGLVWNTNNLVVNGFLAVGSSVSTTPPHLTNSFTQTTLTLSWPVDHVGWRLQGQTNSVQTGLTTNWFEVPGSKTTNQIVLGLSPTNVACFYRLIYP
jgi:autotransporter-associated beta strand protein